MSSAMTMDPRTREQCDGARGVMLVVQGGANCHFRASEKIKVLFISFFRARPFVKRPFAGTRVSCHNRGLALPQETSCLATAHILPCRTRDPSWQDKMRVSPLSFNMHHPSSCMPHARCIMHHLLTTSEVPMFFGHNSTLVAPFGASMGAK